MLSKLAPYRKAVAGFLTPALAALGVALLPGTPGGNAITQGELYSALGAALTTCGVVFKVRNAGRRTQVSVTVDAGAGAAVREALKALRPRNSRKD